MPCKTLNIPGGFAIVCSRGRTPKCRTCGHPGLLLCDYRLPSGQTCDAPLCHRCAVSPKPNVDYCPEHRGKAKEGEIT